MGIHVNEYAEIYIQKTLKCWQVLTLCKTPRKNEIIIIKYKSYNKRKL